MNRLSPFVFFFLFVLGSVEAQENTVSLSQKYESHSRVWKKTRLLLVFNQPKYAPGDTAWFKTYFIDENAQRISGKQLIEFDLVDSNGQSKIHFIFYVIDGVGTNQTII